LELDENVFDGLSMLDSDGNLLPARWHRNSLSLSPENQPFLWWRIELRLMWGNQSRVMVILWQDVDGELGIVNVGGASRRGVGSGGIGFNG
jgi:hypothetical protein